MFVFAQKILPLQAAVLCAIIFATFLTNGFHEDGLADSFDGFGGGWTRDRVLEIMRDSRIGTYGTLALIFLIFGKIIFLSSLPTAQIWRWLVVGHIAARWTILPLCALLPYARAEGQAKLVARQIGVLQLTIGTITLLGVFLVLPWPAAIAVLLTSSLVTLLSDSIFALAFRALRGIALVRQTNSRKLVCI